MKKRFIYFGLVFIAILIVSISCFSYAFFANKIEEHGKLNMVVGTLDYKLESSDLENNKITVNANTMEILTINLKSLNLIKSKYELYYKASDDNDLIIGYGDDSEVAGIVDANSSKKITVIIRNISDTNKEIEFGVQGGFINNELVLGSNKTTLYSYCNLNQEYSFDYTGGEQEFVTPCSGEYQLETWGAQGGSVTNTVSNTKYHGGYGSYSIGNIILSKEEILYINVGGNGTSCLLYGTTTSGTKTCGDDGGYNGGGSTRQYVSQTFYGSGGGATHISKRTGLLKKLKNYNSDILIVSGGGGGASSYSNNTYGAHGGSAGGNVGSKAIVIHIDRSVTCTGGTQNSAGTGSDTSGESFGQGGSLTRYVGPGAGGGYYGGGTSEVLSCGGSGYIGNSLLTNKVMYCYECDESSDESTKTVSTTNVSEEPISNYAKEGNGYAKINYIPADTSDTTNIIVFNSKISNGVTKGDNIKILENSDTEIIEKNIRCVSNKDGYIVDTSNLSLGNHQITCTSKINNKTVEVKSTYIEVTYKAYTVENYYGSRSLLLLPSDSTYSETFVNGITKLDYDPSHKYYYSVLYKSESPIDLYCLSEYFWSNNVIFKESFVAKDNWTKASLYIDNPNLVSTNDLYYRLDNNNGGLDTKAYFDGLLFIDLTETFGEGNEPDKEWCDNHIDYFDGSSTIYK